MNNINKNDRRVRRTKKALREGLSELMLEKELRNITVQELADKADIHRATFYVHYSDIYDLYEQMENEIVKEIKAIIISEPKNTYEELFHTLIDYIYENSNVFRMFLSRKNGYSFYTRICDFIENDYLEFWQEESKEKQIDESWKFYVRYHVQGCLSVLSLWAEYNYAYPKEKIIDIIVNVDISFVGNSKLEL